MAITPPLSGGEHISAHRHPKLLKQLVLPPNISGVSKTKTERDNVTLGFSFYSLSMTFLHDANLSNAFFFSFPCTLLQSLSVILLRATLSPQQYFRSAA